MKDLTAQEKRRDTEETAGASLGGLARRDQEDRVRFTKEIEGQLHHFDSHDGADSLCLGAQCFGL